MRWLSGIAAILFLLGACGASGESKGDQMDRRWEKCLKAGGDFKVIDEWDGKYECKLPKPTPSPTPTDLY